MERRLAFRRSKSRASRELIQRERSASLARAARREVGALRPYHYTLTSPPFCPSTRLNLPSATCRSVRHQLLLFPASSLDVAKNSSPRSVIAQPFQQRVALLQDALAAVLQVDRVRVEESFRGDDHHLRGSAACEFGGSVTVW